MIFFSTDVSLFPAESVFLFFLPFFSPLLLTSRLINVSGRIRMDIPHPVPRVSDSRVEKFPPKWDFWAICVDFAFRDAKSHRERVNTWFLLSEKIIAGRSELIIFHRKNNVFHHNSYVSHRKMDFLSQMRFLLYSIEASSYRVLGKK